MGKNERYDIDKNQPRRRKWTSANRKGTKDRLAGNHEHTSQETQLSAIKDDKNKKLCSTEICTAIEKGKKKRETTERERKREESGREGRAKVRENEDERTRE